MAKVSNSSNVDGNPWTTPTNSSVRSYAIHIWEEPVWFTILRIALTSTIALVGALGNLAVSYVVTKRPEMWTAVNLYIRNLSLTDLGVLLINYPLAVMKERYFNTWPLGEFFCRAIYPGTDAIFCVAIWTIACIAVERYRAVSRKSTYYHGSLKTARIAILTLWIASLVFTCLPLYMTVEYHQVAGGIFKCSFVWPDINTGEYAVFSQYAKAYTYCILIFTYILPLSIILWTYMNIAKTIARSSKFHFQMLNQFSGEQNSARQLILKRLRQNSRVKRLLTPVVLVFALTLLPLYVLKIMPYISLKLFYFKYIYLVVNVSTLLVVLNAAVDPVIYCLVSDNFRNAFKSLVWAHRKKYKRRIRKDKPSFQLSGRSVAQGSRFQRRMTNTTSLFSSKEQLNKDSFKLSTQL